jgi:hypothetical protein
LPKLYTSPRTPSMRAMLLVKLPELDRSPPAKK